MPDTPLASMAAAFVATNGLNVATLSDPRRGGVAPVISNFILLADNISNLLLANTTDKLIRG